MTLRYLANDGGRGSRPLALAHRGFSPAGDENSLAAFGRAVELGFGYLEIDVRTSSDGVVMVFHDQTLERVTDGTGRLTDHTRTELAGIHLRGGGQIPTLEEVLLRWPGLRLNIDVKDDSSVAPVAELVERLQVHDRVLIASFSDRRRLSVLKRLTRRTASSAGIGVNALVTLLGPLGLTRAISRAARIDAVQVPVRYGAIPVVTDGYVRRCHDAGLYVHVWTINDEPAMEQLLGLGVDGLVSDRADILARVMDRTGYWPQGPVGEN